MLISLVRTVALENTLGLIVMFQLLNMLLVGVSTTQAMQVIVLFLMRHQSIKDRKEKSLVNDKGFME